MDTEPHDAWHQLTSLEQQRLLVGFVAAMGTPEAGIPINSERRQEWDHIVTVGIAQWSADAEDTLSLTGVGGQLMMLLLGEYLFDAPEAGEQLLII